MAEAFLSLSHEEQLEALRVAASASGRPDYLLEKDNWVVWALAALFESRFAEHLAFKGGTSLSKAYNAVQRFSEDVDITYDIRELIPAAKSAPNALPPNPSQAKKWGDKVRDEALPTWLANDMLPIILARLAETGSSGSATLDGKEKNEIHINYRPMTASPAYVPQRVKLEFGARSTAEPTETMPVVCDAAKYLPNLTLPQAFPRVMRIERTFWEKATAIHVACLGGRFHRGYARHWYDLAHLATVNYAAGAIADRAIAEQVAAHKSAFFREKDSAGNQVDYYAAIRGALKLVPEGAVRVKLHNDYALMLEAGLLLQDTETVESILERCQVIQDQANASGSSSSISSSSSASASSSPSSSSPPSSSAS